MLGSSSRRVEPRLPFLAALFVVGTLAAPANLEAQDFLRGDFDGNGIVEPVVDFWAFFSTYDPLTQTWSGPCMDAADVDDDGVVDPQDALDLLANFWGQGQGSIPAPGILFCGADPTADALDCQFPDCTPDPPPGPMPGALLSIGPLTGAVLDEVAVPVSLDHADPIRGFSFSICHDPALAEIVGIGLGPDLPVAGPAQSFQHIDVTAGGWEAAYTGDFFTLVPLAPDTRTIYLPTYRLLAEGSENFVFCDTTGVLPMPPRVVRDDGVAFALATSAGAIEVVELPVANDTCADSLPIPEGIHTVATLGAGNDGPSVAGACPFLEIENDLWWTFDVPCDGTLTVKLESTDFPPAVAVYANDPCGTLGPPLACADPSSSFDPDLAFVELPAVAGETLRIQIGGDGSAVGIGTFSVLCDPPPTYVADTDLVPPNPNDLGFFGLRVSLSGNTLAVAEHGDDTTFNDMGAVHIYEKIGDDWVPQALLEPDPLAPLARFGFALELEGDRLAVSQQGRAYVFDRVGGGWVLDASFSPAPGTSTAGYGSTISLSGDTVAVGGQQTGTVRVYRKLSTGWVLDPLVTIPDAGQNQFGWMVRVDGTRLLVSDPTGYGVMGRAHIFDFDGTNWVRTADLIPSDGGFVDLFGLEIDLDGDRAYIGATGHDGGCANVDPCNSGAVYVFELGANGWTEIAKLEGEFPYPEEGFGSSIEAIPGGDLIISSLNGPTQPGAVHVLRETAPGVWTHRQRLDADPPVDGQIFISLAADAEHLVVGSGYDNAILPQAGSVRIHERVGLGGTNVFERGDCNQDGSTNIADAIRLLGYLFPASGGATTPGCLDACDGNDSGGLDIADAIAVLNSLFGSPPTVLPPPSSCGPDTGPDALDCALVGGDCP